MYTTREAARAIGMPRHTMASWLDRRVVVLGENDVDEGCSGRHRLLNMARALQIAISNEMVKLGVNPTRASEAASMFTDRAQPGRRAGGRLFPTGKTLLVASSSETKVINEPHADRRRHHKWRNALRSV